MSQNTQNLKQAELHAAISATEIFKAKYLLANHLAELLGIAETLADHVDPDDDLVNAMSRDLLGKLRDLQICEDEKRAVARLGFALDAQVPLALTVYQGGVS